MLPVPGGGGGDGGSGGGGKLLAVVRRRKPEPTTLRAPAGPPSSFSVDHHCGRRHFFKNLLAVGILVSQGGRVTPTVVYTARQQ